MSISRTIWSIFILFVMLCLEAFTYIIKRIDPRYLRGVIVLDKTIFGNFNAGRIIGVLIHQFYRTVSESIVICKEEYIRTKIDLAGQKRVFC